MSAVRHYTLTKDQRAALGFTDLYIVKWDEATLDAANQNDNDTITVTLDSNLVLGDIIWKAAIQIKTAFVGGGTGAVDTLSASLGYTGSTTGLIGASNLVTTGPAPVAAGTTYATPETVAAYCVTSSSVDLVSDFNPDAAAKCSELTAGELWYWVDISRINQRTIEA